MCDNNKNQYDISLASRPAMMTRVNYRGKVTNKFHYETKEEAIRCSCYDIAWCLLSSACLSKGKQLNFAATMLHHSC